MGLSKLAANSGNTEAVTTPEAVEATEGNVEHTSLDQILGVGDSQALSAPGGATVQNAIASILSVGGEGSSTKASFPIVETTSGNTGGQFIGAGFQEANLNDRLPSGKKPVECVFVGYRMAATAWPSGYGERGDDKSKPVWSCALTPNEATLGADLARAARNYQFTATGQRDKFSVDKGGPGHIRPQIEVLVYLPDVDSPVVFRSCPGFSPFSKTLKAMSGLVDPSTGTLNQFPAHIRPVSVEESSKSGHTWKVHSLEVQAMTTPDAAKGVWDQYQDWLTRTKADATAMQEVLDWMSASDHAITDSIKADIKKAISL